MSNSLQTLVPVLDGSNYRRWAELMKAYLQSMGSWIIIERPTGIEPPTPATDGSNRVDVIEWSQQEAKAQGSIRLRLNVEISRSVKNKTSAKDLWEALQTTYGGSSAMGAFSFFKAAINIRIPANEHPAAAISKITGNLDELAGVGVTLPMHFRALVVLGAAPPRYDATIQMVLNANELKDLKVSHVQTALVASWEQSRNKGQASAQKISAIKQKKGNPSFSQQQRPSGSSSAGQKDGDAKGKAKEGGFTPRGKRGGKFRGKPHRKHRHDEVAEMHIVDMASIPAPTTATVTEIGPSGSKTRKVAAPAPNKGKKRAHGDSDWFRGACQLAKDLDVSATAERLRTLGEVVENTAYIEEVESDTESCASKRSKVDVADQYDWIMNTDEYISGEDDLSPDEDDENFEDAQEPINWADDVENDIAMAAGIPDDDPPIVDNRNFDGSLKCLDLYGDGEDDWEYGSATHFLFPMRITNSALTAASNPPNGARTYVNVLSSSIGQCIHLRNYAACSRCKGKGKSCFQANEWLLDSGASLHITNDIRDFSEFEYLDTPIRTLTATQAVTSITGKGTVFLNYQLNGEWLQTRCGRCPRYEGGRRHKYGQRG